MAGEVDSDMLSIKIKQELAKVQMHLIADFSQSVAMQHEMLVNTLVSKLNGYGSEASTLKAGNSAVGFNDVNFVAPGNIEHGCYEAQFEKSAWARDDHMESSCTTNHMISSSCTTLDTVGADAQIELNMKSDGAFGSIFSASVLEDTDLGETHYHVENYYYTKGCAQFLARSEAFSNLTLAIIAINAVYIGVDADWNPADSLYAAHPVFIVLDNLFCAFFSFELAVRFMAFQKKKIACGMAGSSLTPFLSAS